MGLLEIPCMCDSSTKLRVLISQSQARSCKEGQTKFKMFTMEYLPLPGSAGRCRCPWRSWWWSWSRSAETPPEEIQVWKRRNPISRFDLLHCSVPVSGIGRRRWGIWLSTPRTLAPSSMCCSVESQSEINDKLTSLCEMKFTNCNKIRSSIKRMPLKPSEFLCISSRASIYGSVHLASISGPNPHLVAGRMRRETGYDGAIKRRSNDAQNGRPVELLLHDDRGMLEIKQDIYLPKDIRDHP